jgi:hypothetical protein
MDAVSPQAHRSARGESVFPSRSPKAKINPRVCVFATSKLPETPRRTHVGLNRLFRRLLPEQGLLYGPVPLVAPTFVVST